MGFDIDLAKGLARSLGVSLEERQTDLADLETWLDAEWIDLAVGGMQISPQRAVRHQFVRAT